MDFNSKNFSYVTCPFGSVVDKMRRGERLYLRSLSQTKPSESPALLEEDYPEIAGDFSLPPQLRLVRERQFSSVLRMAGRVNMWLHYDVCALSEHDAVILTSRSWQTSTRKSSAPVA